MLNKIKNRIKLKKQLKSLTNRHLIESMIDEQLSNKIRSK